MSLSAIAPLRLKKRKKKTGRHKRDSVKTRELVPSAIYLGLRSPLASINQPPEIGRAALIPP